MTFICVSLLLSTSIFVVVTRQHRLWLVCSKGFFLYSLRYNQLALLTCSKSWLYWLLPFRCKPPSYTTSNRFPILQWALWSFFHYNLPSNVSPCAIAFSTRGNDAPSLDMCVHTSTIFKRQPSHNLLYHILVVSCFPPTTINLMVTLFPHMDHISGEFFPTWWHIVIT